MGELVTALLVSVHPCADSYNGAVTMAAANGLKAAGHSVTVLDLYGIGFDAVMSRDDLAAYQAGDAPDDPMVREHGDLVRAADTLAFVYPTWWSGLPAVLKGWLERVLVPGIAFTYDDSGKVQPAMQHIRRIVGVSTYGSPWTYNKLMNDNGRRILTRALRLSCGRKTATTWLGLYSIDTTGDNERRAFLDRVEHQLSRLKVERE